MRDPARIPSVLGRIEEVWRRHPDLRLIQLLLAPHPMQYQDMPFYVEDDVLVEALEKRFGDSRHQEGSC
jgi:hypothetical protein